MTSLILGRTEDVVTDLTAALDIAQGGGAPRFVAKPGLSCPRLALLCGDGAGDRSHASELAHDSVALIDRLRMEALAASSANPSRRLRRRDEALANRWRSQSCHACGRRPQQPPDRPPLIVSERTAQNPVQLVLTKLAAPPASRSPPGSSASSVFKYRIEQFGGSATLLGHVIVVLSVAVRPRSEDGTVEYITGADRPSRTLPRGFLRVSCLKLQPSGSLPSPRRDPSLTSLT